MDGAVRSPVIEAGARIFRDTHPVGSGHAGSGRTGRPFTYGHYPSLRTNGVCGKPGLNRPGIVPTAIEAVVPYYLRAAQFGPRDRYR